MTAQTYQVTGMTCEHCVRAVTGELSGLAEISEVRVRLIPGGWSAVTVVSDGPLAAGAVADALAEAGGYRLAEA
jgi:copper chaperone